VQLTIHHLADLLVRLVQAQAQPSGESAAAAKLAALQVEYDNLANQVNNNSNKKTD